MSVYLATVGGWNTMETAPCIDHEPFLILRPKNDVADFVVEQVSMFEGHYYRDFENGLIDYDDRITDGIAWLPMDVLPPFPSEQHGSTKKTDWMD